MGLESVGMLTILRDLGSDVIGTSSKPRDPADLRCESLWTLVSTDFSWKFFLDELHHKNLLGVLVKYKYA